MGVETNLSEARRHFSNWATAQRDVEDVFRFESWWEIGLHCEAFREIGNACRSAGLEEEAAVWLGWVGHEGDEEARRKCVDLVNHGAAWLPKAAESGIDDDDDLRYEYAERGEPDAQVRLGHLYVQGRGVPRDPVTGENWYRGGVENHLRVWLDFCPALTDAPGRCRGSCEMAAGGSRGSTSGLHLLVEVGGRAGGVRRLRRDYA